MYMACEVPVGMVGVVNVHPLLPVSSSGVLRLPAELGAGVQWARAGGRVEAREGNLHPYPWRRG